MPLCSPKTAFDEIGNETLTCATMLQVPLIPLTPIYACDAADETTAAIQPPRAQ